MPEHHPKGSLCISVLCVGFLKSGTPSLVRARPRPARVPAMPTAATTALRRSSRLSEIAFALHRPHRERRQQLLQLSAVAARAMRFLRASHDGLELLLAIFADVFKYRHDTSLSPRAQDSAGLESETSPSTILMIQSGRHNQIPHKFTVDALFCVAITAVLYLRFFRLPFIPIDPVTGDQGIFLWGATKILGGQVIYRDFFQFTTPGTEYFYAFLIKLFGVTATMPKLVSLIAGVAFATAGIAISRFLLTGWRIYLPSLLFLTTGLFPVSDPTHHAFSTLAVLAALLLVLPEASAPEIATWRLTAAGILCGLSFCFTPSRGILAAGALLVFLSLLVPNKKLLSCFAVVGGFLITALLLFGPIAWKAGAHNVFICLVQYPLHNYSSFQWNNPGAYGIDLPIAGFPGSAKPSAGAQLLAFARWLLIYLAVPWAYMLSAVRIWRNGTAGHPLRRQLILVTLTGIALFAPIAYAPTAFRMGTVSLPAFILLVWWLDHEHRLGRCLLVALAIFAVISFPIGILHSQGEGFVILHTPSGDVALSPAFAASSADKYRWLAEHTHPGDFLFSPDYLDYDYLFQLQHPGPTATLWVNDYSTREQVQQTIDAINREQVHYVIWPEDFQDASTVGDRLSPIRALLHDKYMLEHTFSDSDQVWKRKD